MCESHLLQTHRKNAAKYKLSEGLETWRRGEGGYSFPEDTANLLLVCGETALGNYCRKIRLQSLCCSMFEHRYPWDHLLPCHSQEAVREIPMSIQQGQQQWGRSGARAPS